MEAAVHQEEESVAMTLRLSPDLKLPHEAVTQTFAILAMRGVGKTHTASVMAEEFCEARLPFAVLDPTGAWWGLRASADGKGEGYPVTILGGDHADAPLEETAGKVIADMLAEEAPPLVLDMSLLSKGAMRRFVADFAERLYEKNRDPLHLIIDEADAFAPQRPRPDETRMLGALDEIVRRGRIRGLGCTLVTQRSAVLNKDVLTQTECLVVLRTAHPRDRAPVLEWMKVHATLEQLAAVEESLAKLPKGDAWVMSAGWLDLFARVHIRERRTFNSSATPKPGERRVTPRSFARVDPVLLQKRLASAIEKAQASDPALLRKRVVELERELARKPAPAVPAPAKEKRVEVPVLKDAQVKRLEKVLDRIRKEVEAFDGLRDYLVLSSKEIALALHKASGGPPVGSVMYEGPRPGRIPGHIQVPREAIRNTDVEKVAAVLRPTPARRADASPAAAGELTPYALDILRTAAERHPLQLTRSQLGALSGKSTGSSTWLGAEAALKRGGFLALERGRFVVTEQGFATAGVTPGVATSPEEIREAYRRALTDYERKLFDVLAAAYPGAVSREDLGQRAGVSSGSSTFLGAVAGLKRNELVEYVADGVRAAAALFEGAR